MSGAVEISFFMARSCSHINTGLATKTDEYAPTTTPTSNAMAKS